MRRLAVCCVALLVVLSGCNGLFGTATQRPADLTTTANDGTPRPNEPTATPTATPTSTPTATPAPDTDGDGVTDATERQLGTDPSAMDTDGDGLDDGRELELRTNATLADTDGDGLDDGRELELRTNATLADTDADNLTDDRELALGTNATLADTDGDNLSDSRELALDTNATLADTDSDNLTDSRELALGTNATLPDSDGDGLDDGRELELGTNATLADTDSDNLTDDRELALGTNATLPDTDGDNLTDDRELAIGTNATLADTDSDNLTDGRELALGTNATLPDTDGDRLPDGAEVHGALDGARLPDADPLAMDLYVQFNASANAQQFTEAELADLRGAWAEMPVENPDGSTGISLHTFQGGKLNASITLDGDDLGRVERRYNNRSFLGARDGVYHLVLVVEIEGLIAGQAASPGWFSVVDSNSLREVGSMTYRTEVVVHELLHNVVGKLDAENQCPAEFDGESARYHTCEGWLSYDTGPDSQFLPESLAREIEAEGFQPS